MIKSNKEDKDRNSIIFRIVNKCGIDKKNNCYP